MFSLTILGISAATPAFSRHPTAQVLNLPHTRFLIDCGEGTQMQMQKHKVKINKIKHILITHLHGDHYLGLVGLLSTMHLQKRNQPLCIYGPRDLGEIIRLGLKVSNTQLSYPLDFFPVPDAPAEIFYEDEQMVVETLQMNHRIQCTGYLFREKPKKRKVYIERLPENIPWSVITRLKEGEDVWDEERKCLYKSAEYSYQPARYSFAHCSDTLYQESILSQIEKVDMMYHEATFLHADIDKARATFHSTAWQAGHLAAQAQVKKLIIGHFSSRYRDLQPFLTESRFAFQNSYLGKEGGNFSL